MGLSRLGRAGMIASALCLFLTRGLAASPSASSVSVVPAGLTSVDYRGHRYLIRIVDPKIETLRLDWKDQDGSFLHDFRGLEKEVRRDGEMLVFAANAGMFEPDFSSVGLLVLNGAEASPLNLRDGVGNFYLKPNGVFALTDQNEARVMESGSYETFLPHVLWATQSGPLLVHEGDIHPDLNAGSLNLMIRSGVGVRRDGKIIFALSRAPVNFYDFAVLFRSRLQCLNALYLDGHISAFYVPGMSEKPGDHLFGPMFALVKKG